MWTIEQALERQGRYQANENVLRAISNTALVAFVGGTAVGKNFYMDATGLPITGTETTRAPRPDDDPARYTYSDQAELLLAIEAGEVVQYGVSLPSDIYASRIRDYTLGKPNVSDIWYDAVGSLENKGFASLKSVSILTPKTQWLSQLSLRLDHMPITKAIDRLSEARRSVRWSLTQQLGGVASHLTIINQPGSVDKNIERIINFAYGYETERTPDDHVRQTANEMFETIDTLYDRFGL